MRTANKQRGGDFDAFLEQNGILAECEAAAVKRILAWQLEQAMRTDGISKAELSRRMHSSRAGVDRLLDTNNHSVTLKTMEKAARAVNCRLCFELKPL